MKDKNKIIIKNVINEFYTHINSSQQFPIFLKKIEKFYSGKELNDSIWQIFTDPSNQRAFRGSESILLPRFLEITKPNPWLIKKYGAGHIQEWQIHSNNPLSNRLYTPVSEYNFNNKIAVPLAPVSTGKNAKELSSLFSLKQIVESKNESYLNNKYVNSLNYESLQKLMPHGYKFNYIFSWAKPRILKFFDLNFESYLSSFYYENKINQLKNQHINSYLLEDKAEYSENLLDKQLIYKTITKNLDENSLDTTIKQKTNLIDIKLMGPFICEKPSGEALIKNATPIKNIIVSDSKEHSLNYFEHGEIDENLYNSYQYAFRQVIDIETSTTLIKTSSRPEAPIFKVYESSKNLEIESLESISKYDSAIKDHKALSEKFIIEKLDYFVLNNFKKAYSAIFKKELKNWVLKKYSVESDVSNLIELCNEDVENEIENCYQNDKFKIQDKLLYVLNSSVVSFLLKNPQHPLLDYDKNYKFYSQTDYINKQKHELKMLQQRKKGFSAIEDFNYKDVDFDDSDY